MTRPLAALLDLWHAVVSPALPPACRFHPTCSTYAAESLRRFGFFSGGLLALRRLARCHPWNPGGLDPVPEHRLAQAASRLPEVRGAPAR